MARRKGISANKSRSNTSRKPLQEAAQQCTPDNHEDPGGGINVRPKDAPVGQNTNTMEHSINNNNDQKYLHKKFKRIAVAITEDTTKSITPLTNIGKTEYKNQIKHPQELNNKSDINNTTILNIPINETNTTVTHTPNAAGRYVCHYCKLSCAKPSVLEKHIRAHTNERPYPCVPCGFAFKTKSNLYKHCRSRAHGLRVQGSDVSSIASGTIEDDCSLGSDPEVSSNASVNSEPVTSSTRSESVATSRNSSPMEINDIIERNTPPTTASTSSATMENKPKGIYKPKFHKASLYQEEEETSQAKPLPTNSEFLDKHISKIISENEAIVDVVEPPLQKKYNKITNMQRQLIVGEASSSKLALALLKNDQPLNLTKISEAESNHRKRCFSESFVQPEAAKISQHPQNPEGSIIKDLLLKARAQGNGIAVAPGESLDAETLYICPLCRIPYRSADNLEVHRLYYCKGTPGSSPHSAPMSPIGSPNNPLKLHKPDSLFYRSNSIHVNLPETYNPNTLAKLASTTLRTPAQTIHNPNSLAKLASTTLRPPRSRRPENLYTHNSDRGHSPLKTRKDVVAVPLPSPGPLLGNTRLVDAYNISKHNDNYKVAEEYSNSLDAGPRNTSPLIKREPERIMEVYNHVKAEQHVERPEEICTRTSDNYTPVNNVHMNTDNYSPPVKKSRLENTPTTLRSLEELSLSPMRQNSLQMFGGEVRIVDNSGETKTMRIEPSRNQNSPTLISTSMNSPRLTPGPQETSSIVVRSGLHSGGTIVHNPPTPKEVQSPNPSTPKLMVSIAPNINTPNLAVAGIPAPNIAHFQFPPLNSITGYNPLTLPPVSPGSASTIMHGGKLIPYVPGMPGPNTLSASVSIGVKSVKQPESPIKESGPSPKQHVFNLPSPSREQITSPVGLNMSRRSPNHRNVPSPLTLNSGIITATQNTASPNSMAITFLRNNPGSMTTNTSSVISTKVTTLSIPCIKIDASEDTHIRKNLQLMSPGGNKLNLPNGASQHSRHKIEDLIWKNAELPGHTISKDMWITANNFQKHKINNEKSFNFSRMADNISPRKSDIPNGLTVVASSRPITKSPEMKKAVKTTQAEIRHFNFENLISKSEILNKHPIETKSNKLPDINMEAGSSGVNVAIKCLDTTPTTSERTSETSYFKKNMDPSLNTNSDGQKNSRFLRPSSLPLKPGTFTPKRHHGITPNSNTLPLISPETPRPAKAYGQLYLNGHAYTYLGLKCSTKTYFCTLNRPQPMYVANQHTLSMYSTWRIQSEAGPNPLGMTSIQAMNHYDSRHRPQKTTIAKEKHVDMLTHSSKWLGKKSSTNSKKLPNEKSQTYARSTSSLDGNLKRGSNLAGGFESNEEYTYVRGRGRGRYVCSECGIRCKKPSMLKKHIRTHTDVRPFTCRHCAFSFKTKGNLTKHMKSKAHYKKCIELGISPVPTTVEDGDCGATGTTGEPIPMPGDSDSDTDSDGDEGNEGETESSDTDESKSRLPEHEAAHCLLSLSGSIANTDVYEATTPGVLSVGRPCTYPYSILQHEIQSISSSQDTTKDSDESLDMNISHTVIDVGPFHKQIIHNTNSSDEIISKPMMRESCIEVTNSSDYYSHSNNHSDNSNHHKLNLVRKNSVIMSTHSQPMQSKDLYNADERHINQPMDLTKPRNSVSENRLPERSMPLLNNKIIETTIVSEPITLKTTSESCAPKISELGTRWTQEEPMLQAYLTERALQDSRKKQCQYAAINKSIVSDKSESETNQNFTSVNTITKTYLSSNTKSVIQNRNRTYSDSKVYPVEPKEHAASIRISESESGPSRIDTLAEIAASSSKLETSNDPICKSDVSMNSPKSSTDNAKIVASEYLKMASEKSKTNDAFEGPSVVNFNQNEKKNCEEGTKSSESNVKSLEIIKQGEIVPSDCSSLEGEHSEQSKHSSEHMSVARKVVVGAGGVGFKMAAGGNDFPSAATFATGRLTEDGRSVCVVCSKTFSKPSQLRLHINIHYFERPFRCEPCAVSFRTKGHLQKHERSVAHHNKVSMTSTFGAATTTNPRPFKCSDCKIAFRIHGHLAKHLRSKMHVMRLECLGKLPFGTYAEIERAGVSLTDIDTTDCDNSLASLQILAQKLHEKDPTKLGAWDPETMAPPLLPAGGESDSEEGELLSPQNTHEDISLLQMAPGSPAAEQINTSCHSASVSISSFKTINEIQGHNYVEQNVQITNASSDNSASERKRKHDLEIGANANSEVEEKKLKLADS